MRIQRRHTTGPVQPDDSRVRVGGVPRREFLRLGLLAPMVAFTARLDAATTSPRVSLQPRPDGRPHRFELASRRFVLDGQPFVIRCGEMHPIRIPREYWTHRIRMAKAMGLNTIALYVMWNALESEPGVFDLTTGRRDFAHFIRLCGDEGMWVYLRPGPYVCAEWDFGGLPPYLLRHPGIRVRDKDDPDYMDAVRRYIATLAPVVRPLLVGHGGPILMLQVENEYASFGTDLAYLEAIRALWQQHGVHGPFSISDGLAQIQKAGTYLPGTALGLDGDTDFAAAQKIAGDMPVWMGEGYTGWLTHWGDKAFARGDFDATLHKLLDDDRSFNLYVAHGGTNFGFGAGANAKGDYTQFQPVITSYDYGAPIDERGAPTPDYHAFRAMLAPGAQRPLSGVPDPLPAITFPPLRPEPKVLLWDNLPAMRHVATPQGNELLFGQDHGMVVYRRTLHAGGELELRGVRDYAMVFLDGRYLDYVSRVEHPSLRSGNRVTLPVRSGRQPAVLEILVDSFGHIGYGQAMADRKGIVDDIRLDGERLQDWDVAGLPLDVAWRAGLEPVRGKPTRPGVFFGANLALEETGDVYLDMAAWDRGYLWVNGHLLGRYWNLGPQQRLYCPGPLLKRGGNEILVLDLHRVESASIRGVDTLDGVA